VGWFGLILGRVFCANVGHLFRTPSQLGSCYGGRLMHASGIGSGDPSPSPRSTPQTRYLVSARMTSTTNQRPPVAKVITQWKRSFISPPGYFSAALRAMAMERTALVHLRESEPTRL
jgi:hypothetical protein